MRAEPVGLRIMRRRVLQLPRISCARHGALLLLVEARRETKTPAVTGRKGNANKARANPETGSLKEA